MSQVRIAAAGSALHAVRIGQGEADLILGTDAVVASSADALRAFALGHGAIVLNVDKTPTADIVSDRDATLPTEQMINTLMSRAGDRGFALSATRIAEGLFGNNVAANTLILGYAWQQGLLPLSDDAIFAAIEANGVAIALNKRAFSWGRLAAADLQFVESAAGLAMPLTPPAEGIAAMIARRVADLTTYQDRAYGNRYAGLMQRVVAVTKAFDDHSEELIEAVSINAYRVMAYKDEYEVARLYSEPAFRQSLDAQFVDMKRLSVHLAPPFLSRIDPRTGRPAKRKFGPWILSVMSVLAMGKRLRGSHFDPFGRSSERRAERALRDEYLATIDALLLQVDAGTYDNILAVAKLPSMVRGFGPVKEEAMARYRVDLADLMVRIGEPNLNRLAA